MDLFVPIVSLRCTCSPGRHSAARSAALGFSAILRPTSRPTSIINSPPPNCNLQAAQSLTRRLSIGVFQRSKRPSQTAVRCHPIFLSICLAWRILLGACIGSSSFSFQLSAAVFGHPSRFIKLTGSRVSWPSGDLHVGRAVQHG